MCKKYFKYLEKKKIFTDGIFKKLKNAIYDSGFVSHIRTGDGLEMIELLMDESLKVDVSSWEGKNKVINLTHMHAPLSKNKCWMNFQPKLFCITQKGTGEGEVLLRLTLKDVKKEKDQDINASGLHFEVKTKVANLKAHGKKHNRFVATNSAAKECGWINKKNKAYQGLFQEKNLSKIVFYLRKVYFDWDPARVRRVAAYIHENSEEDGKEYVGVEVMRDYSKVDGFDLYMHIDAKTLRAVVIGDFDDSFFITQNLAFTVPIRGNCSQSLADGYVGAKLKRRPRGKR